MFLFILPSHTGQILFSKASSYIFTLNLSWKWTFGFKMHYRCAHPVRLIWLWGQEGNGTGHSQIQAPNWMDVGQLRPCNVHASKTTVGTNPSKVHLGEKLHGEHGDRSNHLKWVRAKKFLGWFWKKGIQILTLANIEISWMSALQPSPKMLFDLGPRLLNRFLRALRRP